MTKLLTHCGSTRCSIEQLLTIPEPEKTNSYTPLNHYDFAVNVRTVTSDLLRDFTFNEDQYALSSDGQKMFGVLTFSEKSIFDDKFLKLSIGLRNSYDKSMSAGLCVGASVIVCDNLMFRGDITILRKHTGETMHEELMDQLVTAIYKSQHQFTQLSEDAGAMRRVQLSTRAGFEYLGVLTGEKVLSPTQSTRAFQEMRKPSHSEFSKPTLWSYYNHATEALKSSPPQSIIKKHMKLHQLTCQLYLD
ncbi:MAG: DUF932 domain-containing protein [Balneolaceae bacterium]|nr:DUF932 domain-containing protein [Balneolaceae bacterium]